LTLKFHLVLLFTLCLQLLLALSLLTNKTASIMYNFVTVTAKNTLPTTVNVFSAHGIWY